MKYKYQLIYAEDFSIAQNLIIIAPSLLEITQAIAILKLNPDKCIFIILNKIK